VCHVFGAQDVVGACDGPWLQVAGTDVIGGNLAYDDAPAVGLGLAVEPDVPNDIWEQTRDVHSSVST
jgi:hypothetical protein